jgi:hypothetical protein
MPTSTRSSARPRAPMYLLVVMSVAALVHWGAPEGSAKKAQNKAASEKPAGEKAGANPPSVVSADALPLPVVEMRDAILAAVRTGSIEDLKPALQWNEMPPVISSGQVDDPIGYWKSLSGDGQGRDILAMIDSLFAAGHTMLPVGRDVENSRMFVWPRFAEMDLSKLKPEDEVQLYRLATPAEVRAMIAKKRWTGYRLVIGAEGIWHSFQKTD